MEMSTTLKQVETSVVIAISCMFLIRACLRQSKERFKDNISNNGVNKRFLLYMNPLCPFAQRTYAVVLELHCLSQFRLTPIPLNAELQRAKHWKQLPPWSQAVGVTDVTSLEQLKEWYKTHVNDEGAVPSLVDENHPIIVKESEIVAEYIERSVAGNGSGLFPNEHYSPEDVIRFRFGLKLFQKDPFYALLRNQDPSKDEEFSQALSKQIHLLVSHMSCTGGSYYLGSRLSFVDFALAPFVYRFSHLLKYFRKFDMFSTERRMDYDVARFHEWYQAVSRVDSFKKTCPPVELVLNHYELEANDGKINATGYYGRGKTIR